MGRDEPYSKKAKPDDAIPQVEASRISGLTKIQLYKGHQHGCALFDGEKLWSRKFRVTDNTGRLQWVRHYSKEEMEEIKRRREAIAKLEEDPDPIVKGYLSPNQVDAELDMPYDSLRHHWEPNAKKLGLKTVIRTKEMPIPGRKNGKLTYSRREDAEKYAQRRQAPSQLDRAKALLKEQLKNGPVQFREILKQGRLQGISEKALRRAKRAENVCATQRGWSSPCYRRYPEDADKVPLAMPTAAERPIRTEALKLIRQALTKGATRFRDVRKLGEEKGIGEGSMWLAWKGIRTAEAQADTSTPSGVMARAANRTEGEERPPLMEREFKALLKQIKELVEQTPQKAADLIRQFLREKPAAGEMYLGVTALEGLWKPCFGELKRLLAALDRSQMASQQKRGRRRKVNVEQFLCWLETVKRLRIQGFDPADRSTWTDDVWETVSIEMREYLNAEREARRDKEQMQAG